MLQEELVKCYICKRSFPATEEYFYKQSSGRLERRCKECRKNMRRLRYAVQNGLVPEEAVLTPASENEEVPSKKRQYTPASDMLILQLLVEDGYSVHEVASALNRDADDLKAHLFELVKTGKLRKLHRRLLNYGGIYAVRYRKRLRLPNAVNI